ncbi:MAG TPA: DUF530 family protein [archaeon]|nr:DUF530 family protein [archaeon]
MAEAYPLTGKAERLLNIIEELGANINLPRLLRDSKYLLEIYRILQKDYADLDRLRDDIEFRGGVYAPYPSPRTMGTAEVRETPEGPPSEIGYLMRYAKIKSVQLSAIKATIDRLRAALAAHRIAINHLTEYCAVLCQDCGKFFRGKPALKAISTNKCPNCGSSKILFTPNNVGIFRIELIPYLPLSGDYMRRITQLPSHARITYGKMTRYLRESVGGRVRSFSIIVRVQVGDKTLRRRISFRAEPRESVNYEAVIRKRFGPSARIESIRYHRTQPVLLNDRYTRACIALAYVSLTYDVWASRKSQVRIVSRKIDAEKTLLKLPIYVLIHDLARYFLLKPPKSRRRLAGAFPYLESSPQASIVESLFAILQDEDSAFAAKMLGLTGETIPLEVIRLKFVIEKNYETKIRDLGLVSSRGIAAALLYLTSKYDLPQASNFFNTTKSEGIKALEKLAQADISSELPESGRDKLANIEAPRTTIAKEFIKALKET